MNIGGWEIDVDANAMDGWQQPMNAFEWFPETQLECFHQLYVG